MAMSDLFDAGMDPWQRRLIRAVVSLPAGECEAARRVVLGWSAHDTMVAVEGKSTGQIAAAIRAGIEKEQR